MSLTPPKFLAPLLVRPVAIFGGGVSGDGVQAALHALGAVGVVYDLRGSEFTAAVAHHHSLVVFSPGFAPDHRWLALARAAGCTCLGELDFAALLWRGRIVAITGTNGKTTLTEFLTHALGRDAHATGNIGYPFSRLVAETEGGHPGLTAVCEVSSFQAETLQHFRADATLWTNFAEDHLERHPTMAAYFNAKWNLVAHTAPGRAYVGSSVSRFLRTMDCDVRAVTPVATEGQEADHDLAATVFAQYPQRENYLLARAWWIASGRNADDLAVFAQTFHLGRHRLARVAEHDGITYWNDSKATNFHAVEAALSGFSAPVLLIAGGKSKGGDIAGFVARIAPHVRQAFLIGETRASLAMNFAQHGTPHIICPTLEAAVQAASHFAKPGDHVLLSPGFASFDMFRNYEDRGNQFEHLAHEVGTGAGVI